MTQKTLVTRNKVAWETDAYAAWVSQYGKPLEVARKLQANPVDKLRRVIDYLPELHHLKIANPLGSNGRIATALALLGANVTVFDLSESNARYANELFDAAGVDANYLVGDFLTTAQSCNERFDAIVMELGILHYFHDINQFVAALRCLVSVNCTVVLNEFHPLNKSISIDAGEIALAEDYFNADTVESRTPFEIHIETEVPACLIRRWTLGETISAFAAGGFRIEKLIELPAGERTKLPGMYTLVATSD